MADSEKAGLRQIAPSLFNGIATAVAAIAGLIGVLHETGYIGKQPEPVAAVQPAVESHPHHRKLLEQSRQQLAAADAPAAAAASELPASAANAVASADAASMAHHNLNGAWRDMASNCHQIKQAGHQLTVSSYAGDTGQLKTVGAGTVTGRAVSVKLNSSNPQSLEADLVLSADGRMLSGLLKGRAMEHLARWHYAGPSCVQTTAAAPN